MNVHDGRMGISERHLVKVFPPLLYLQTKAAEALKYTEYHS